MNWHEDQRPAPARDAEGHIHLEGQELQERQWDLVRLWWEKHPDREHDHVLPDEMKVARAEKHDDATRAWTTWVREGMAEAFAKCLEGGNEVLASFLDGKTNPSGDKINLVNVLQEVTKVRDANQDGS